MLITKKVYYEDPFLYECDAEVIKIIDNKIYLDRTVAYPEGGGQISDIGWLIVGNNEIEFTDVQKSMGTLIHPDNFPSIKINTLIYHVINHEDVAYFEVGTKLKVKINVLHRIKTTVLHSALHLALKFAIEKRPNLYSQIIGCKISEDNARLDFSSERFLPDEIEYINNRLKEELELDTVIDVFPHELYDEAWYWRFKDFTCPCGGTHVKNIRQIGDVFARRKAIGKGKERLIVTVSNIRLNENDYHN